MYSYGEHFPIYVAEVGDNGEVHWYENDGKWSRSTTRHQQQARPSYVKFTPMNVGAMQCLARHGIAGVAARGVA